jgi:SAM-dependent methyltransferase
VTLQISGGRAASARFGEGADEPYESAIRHGGGVLRLLPADAITPVGGTAIDVSRYDARANSDDLHALRRTTGPVLDVGSGPGRMVHAAIRLGRLALGIDVSPAAVTMATGRGLPVLHRSVFDSVPLSGFWGTALLLDGNIGIGGDPVRLLARCRDLLGSGGEILVECHPSARRDSRFEAALVDSAGRRSGPFPWAELGIDRLVAHAATLSLTVSSTWIADGRRFAVLATG